MDNLMEKFPKMLSGDELKAELRVFPTYKEELRDSDKAKRLLALSNIYKIYIPSEMSVEIYHKLYMSVFMSLQKKGSLNAVRQYNENFKGMQKKKYRGVIGGSYSFTIIGSSGIGKSSSVERAIDVMQAVNIIEIQEPYTKITPCILVQCPFDCSSKGLLLEILRLVDERLETNYYKASQRAAVTTDILIGTVSQVALNHIGLLIIDEIQNVVWHKGGKALLAMLTQLINCSGISICMVGTPESTVFFESAMQLARRSLGLYYSEMKYDDYFREFCTSAFSFQYVQKHSEISDAIIEWLYEHSAGIISNVITLIYLAQESAILNGKEVLNLETLQDAYDRRMTMLHQYIEPSIIRNNKPTKIDKNKILIPKNDASEEPEGYEEINVILKRSRENNLDMVELIREQITIEEVLL